MSSFGKKAGIGLVAAALATGAFHNALAEPLMTVFAFSKDAYTDGKSNEVVVTVTRTDQDPATANEAFTVKWNVTGGDAVENRDFTVGSNGSTWGVGNLRFPPGVRAQSITIHTRKTQGPNKTLLLGLSDPEGTSPAVTGNNTTAKVTIVNK